MFLYIFFKFDLKTNCVFVLLIIILKYTIKTKSMKNVKISLKIKAKKSIIITFT